MTYGGLSGKEGEHRNMHESQLRGQVDRAGMLE